MAASPIRPVSGRFGAGRSTARRAAGKPGGGGPKGRRDEIRALAPHRLQELLRRRRVQDRAGPDRRRRPERLRQVEPRRGASLGDGRKLVQGDARARAWTTSSSPAPASGRRATSPRSACCSTTPTARAPAAFNEHETIEVTRRIERDSGSTYRVNGKEVRARDVQLLFADASTGARSPALVRQGQIGEIIAAKPQARRLILEEAAGISGLHSRRHEAELRLKGAEDNLLRVEDVLKQIDVQVDSLKRQARQSSRYRNLAADIRRHDALAHLIAWREARDGLRRGGAEAGLGPARRRRAHPRPGRGGAPAGARRRRAAALREEEARRGAALHRITLARDALEAEEKRARERGAELERRAAQFARDLEREQALIADAAAVVERLAAEDAVARRGARRRRRRLRRKRASARRRRAERLAVRRGRARRGAGRLVRPQRAPPCARGRRGRGRPPPRPARSRICGDRARARRLARLRRRRRRARAARRGRGRARRSARRGRGGDARRRGAP